MWPMFLLWFKTKKIIYQLNDSQIPISFSKSIVSLANTNVKFEL